MARPRVSVSRNRIIQLYVTEHKSGLETARLLGIGRATLSRYLDIFGIPRRGNNEALKGRRLSPEHRGKVITNLVQFSK